MSQDNTFLDNSFSDDQSMPDLPGSPENFNEIPDEDWIMRTFSLNQLVASRQKLMLSVYRLFKTAAQSVIVPTELDPTGFHAIRDADTEEFISCANQLVLCILFNPFPLERADLGEIYYVRQLTTWSIKNIVPQLRNLSRDLVDACKNYLDQHEEYNKIRKYLIEKDRPTLPNI